ncbi:MAG TPA: 50S ribosomal protein L25 [Candidatus Eisenbacteria bacterium]|jgi:large subunit ribosomal protein L25|nr:50S ribosomal protein L25 [Candidatus Eisenbacteria bacterium]
MEQIQLKATIRDTRGKQASKKLRTAGLVPAVVYHRGEEPVSITLVDKEISKIVQGHGGENILINLTIEKEKKKSRAVIIKEIQHDPVKRWIRHIDFNEISLSEKITVDVEVIPDGEAIGVKQDGGLLDHPLREVKIQCLPTDIPKNIKVDVSGLKLNDSLHVRDLVVSDKIKILTDPDLLLFQVKLHEEEKPADATAETPELEVIREKKEEEGAAGEKKEEAKKEAAPKAEKK